jgi:hypothetical protein
LIDDVRNETDLERFLTDGVTPHLPVSGVSLIDDEKSDEEIPAPTSPPNDEV